MSATTRLSAIANHIYTKRILCFGVLPLAFTGLGAVINHEKLDAPARTADHQAAQLVAKDLGSFIEKAKGGEEELVEAYNSRKVYLEAPAQEVVASCMRQALMPQHGSIEIAQTVPQTKITSYRAPMATDLQYANNTTVAVVNFSKTALTDCANASFAEFKAVPTADQSRLEFYRIMGQGLLVGLLGGAFIYNQRTSRPQPARAGAPTHG